MDFNSDSPPRWFLVALAFAAVIAVVTILFLVLPG